MTGALGGLEWSFIALVSTMSLLASVFALYALVQIFRNPRRR